MPEIGLIFGSYLLVFVAYYALGVTFYTVTFTWYSHFIDPVLLRNDLARSLFYLHSQPPLFNLLLGIGLKLFPRSYFAFYDFINHAFGLLLYGSLFVLMRQLGVRFWLAYVVATLFAASPSFVLYENYLFYTQIVTAVLCLSAVVLNRFVRQRRNSDGLLFFFLVAGLCGTWTLFHLVFFLFVIVGVVLLSRIPARKVLGLALVPLLLVTSLYVKNKILFGEFTATTWTGMNEIVGVEEAIPADLENQLVQEKLLSPFVFGIPFKPLSEIRKEWPAPVIRSSIPVLDEEVKSTGAPNFNNLAYIAVSKQCAADSAFIIKTYPDQYIKRVVRACGIYFSPSDEFWFLGSHNLARSEVPRGFYWKLTGAWKGYQGQHYIHHVCWLLVIAFPVVLGYAGWMAFRLNKKGDAAAVMALAYPLCAIVYVMAACTTYNMIECNRIRYTTDALFMALAAFAAEAAYRALSRSRTTATTVS